MKKKKQNILLLIMGILIVMEILISVYYLIFSDSYSFLSLCVIVALSFIGLYGICLYKKPHGNILKYAMLFLALVELIYNSRGMMLGAFDEFIGVVGIVASAIIVYVAGRLNRIEQNKYLLAIVLLSQISMSVICLISTAGIFPPLFYITYFQDSIATLTLMIAYFVRYKEHKEAGISDK